MGGGWVEHEGARRTEREEGDAGVPHSACFGLLDTRAWVWIAAKVWETIRNWDAAPTSFRDVRARGRRGEESMLTSFS